jgi:hypothetical protein
MQQSSIQLEIFYDFSCLPISSNLCFVICFFLLPLCNEDDIDGYFIFHIS